MNMRKTRPVTVEHSLLPFPDIFWESQRQDLTFVYCKYVLRSPQVCDLGFQFISYEPTPNTSGTPYD